MGGKLWLFLLLGCCLLAGCQQTETVSVPPAVGCYPVEGYAPDPADLAAAPAEDRRRYGKSEKRNPLN